MPPSSPWIVPPRSALTPRRRLFCLPYAGGAASIYRDWPSLAPPGVGVCAIQLPARERRLREAPLASMSAVLEGLTPALRPWLDLPFALFGHSIGALIAFELTRRLRRDKGPQPDWLFVSACTAPQLARPSHQPLHDLPRDELVAELRRLQGTPEAVLDHPELLDLLLPALRADFAVWETYRYTDEPPLACPLTAVGGRDDPEVSEEGVRAWAQQTTGPFDAHLFPGDHFFLRPAQDQLLEVVNRHLQSLPGADADTRRGLL